MSNTSAPQNYNATANKLLWFILTGITAIVFAVVGSWATNVDRRLNDAIERQIATEKAIIEINAKLDIILRVAGQDLPHIKITPERKP
jgi:hypothetical protein